MLGQYPIYLHTLHTCTYNASRYCLLCHKHQLKLLFAEDFNNKKDPMNKNLNLWHSSIHNKVQAHWRCNLQVVQ